MKHANLITGEVYKMIEKFKVDGTEKIKLKDMPTSSKGDFKEKDEALILLGQNINIISELQNRLYADNTYSILIIFQAMDAAGKDATIKHVFSGVNPQGFQVYNFKQPSREELDHGYLWRTAKSMPERGRIGIFNRSYYEDVLVVKVHNLLHTQGLPKDKIYKDIWERRYQHIRNQERYMYENGIIPIKFFLHVSKEKQKERFIERIEDPAKNWKFSMADVEERKYWDDYQSAYEDAINGTSREHAPWYVIPADKKWFAKYLVSEIVKNTMEKLDLKYPVVRGDQKKELKKYKEMLLKEE